MTSLLAEEEIVETLHRMGHELSYRARVGFLPLKGRDDKVAAQLFFVSYTLEGEDLGKRPITFCFNGGPGSSSIWLHMGMLGPKRVAHTLDSSVAPPYSLVDNEFSVLDLTDLVFIDPVSTGFSRAEEPRQFHGVEEDVESIADFIRLYVSKYGRWDSPKYLAGESYGTTRAAGVALKLHEDEFLYLNGLVLISPVLNFQTIYDYHRGNDLPYILSLPSFTAAALYHKKELKSTLKQAEEFALDVYAAALLKGDRLSDEEKRALAAQLSNLTGLKESFILDSNLRVSICRFAKELLREEGQLIGVFDSRYVGVSPYPTDRGCEYDPSLEAIGGAYSATFNQYVRGELGWKQESAYAILPTLSWSYRSAQNCYLNVAEKLRHLMARNRHLKVFFASGLYDLATPYFATEYLVNHLFLDPSLKKNVVSHLYPAGHMMYTDEAVLKQMKKDLTSYFLGK